MYAWAKSNLFWQDGVHKDWYIEILEDETFLTNEDLVDGSISYTNGISDNSAIKPGTCQSAEFKFETIHSDNLVGKTIAVWLGLDGDTEDLLPIGVFEVTECDWDAERTKRSVVSYDYMNAVLNTDVTQWYNDYWDSKENPEYGTNFIYFLIDFVNAFGITIANKNGSYDNPYVYLVFVTNWDSITVKEWADYSSYNRGDEPDHSETFDSNGGNYRGYFDLWWTGPSYEGATYGYWYWSDPNEMPNQHSVSAYHYEYTYTWGSFYPGTAPKLDGWYIPAYSMVYRSIGTNQQIFGSTILCDMLEAAGLFGIINRFGEMQLVRIGGWSYTDGEYYNLDRLYPGDIYPYATQYDEPVSGYREMYPGGPDNIVMEVTPDIYETVEYADYVIKGCDSVFVYNEKNELYKSKYIKNEYGYVPSDPSEVNNPYNLVNNWTTFGELDERYSRVDGEELLNAMAIIEYRPCKIKMMGNPCLDPGDRIEVITAERPNRPSVRFDTIILNRTMTGLQTLVDEISADGNIDGNPNFQAVASASTRLSNIERQLYSGTAGGSGGGVPVYSVESLPVNPDYGSVYLIQGEVLVV